ncbi:MAG: glycosyltransferase family 4 protein [Armatimonadetes bacterium]|nr:glycosyltransferase family 4 protein [Armatimonadota bacterium]
MPPTIGYLLGEFPSLTETFILREMKELVRQGLRLHIFSLTRPKSASDPLPAELAPVHVDYGPGRMDPSLLSRAFRGLFSGGPSRPRIEAATDRWLKTLAEHREIVHLHAHFANEPALTAMAMSKASGLPFSFTAHAWDIYCSGTPLSELIAAAQFTATCTEANARYLHAKCRSEDRDKIFLVRHGIELEPFCSEDWRPSKPFRCLAIGRLVGKKGFDVLLKALGILNDRRIQTVCNVVGDGPERERLQQLRKETGVQDTVQFLGARPPSDTLQRLRESDALIVPSVITSEGDRDGLPNVILEAAANGIPIVASDLPGISEFVADEVSGLLASSGDPKSLADKIEVLAADNGALAETLRRNARRIVEEEYDIRKNVGPLIALFNQFSNASIEGACSE